MRFAVTGLATFLLLAATGCSLLKHQSNADPKDEGNAGSKLKATTSRMTLETYHGRESFVPPAPPPKIDGPFRIKTSWLPGEISVQPFTVVEPFKNQGKPPKKNKGVRFDITSTTYVIDGRKGKPIKASAYLDETEARDFDTALSFLADTAATWGKKKPDPRQEARYQVKDSLVATLSFEGEELMLVLVARGNVVFEFSYLQIPVSNIGDVQAKLRAALKTLEGT
ncbi:MAG TPA: hypothetical protein VG759_26285 [Candidatus Angelobacter sp.]|jgi:hypothetical protein|nr:hypothetical protein [Candidatus Angelobacter sp.]